MYAIQPKMLIYKTPCIQLSVIKATTVSAILMLVIRVIGACEIHCTGVQCFVM